MPKERPTKIVVIGNYSGRNAGDAAILDGLLRDITETFADTAVEFEVPTINPGFIRQGFPGYPVRPVGLLPWNGSIKILGLPLLRCCLRADLILVTDAVLFDRRLYNPLFNYLHTLSWVLPLAARRGVPVVLYNVTLGVVHTRAGRSCLGRVLRASKKVIVRDPPSVDLARSLFPEGGPPARGADCALSSRVAPDDEVDELAETHGVLRSGRPVLAFNVNSYLEAFLGSKRSGLSRDRFQAIVAAVLDQAVRDLGVEVLMVQTHPMDARMTDQILDRVDERQHVGAIRNPPLSHRALTGFLGRAEAAVAMRTHVLILASLMRTPVAGLIAYPKTLGYLESIGMGEMALEFGDFGEESLWGLVSSLWNRRGELQQSLIDTMPSQEALAADAARHLADWLGVPVPFDRARGDLRISGISGRIDVDEDSGTCNRRG